LWELLAICINIMLLFFLTHHDILLNQNAMDQAIYEIQYANGSSLLEEL